MRHHLQIPLLLIVFFSCEQLEVEIASSTTRDWTANVSVETATVAPIVTSDGNRDRDSFSVPWGLLDQDISVPKESLGRFQMTYYWVATESKKQRGEQMPLYDKTCETLAYVNSNFRRRLILEGTGKLKDGRLITTAGGCQCGAPCFWIAGRRHKWGAGVAQRPLAPFRSVAVDPKLIDIGTSLYVPELDGLRMPGRGREGGFIHNGCVVADDRGGNIRGKQLDFFAARRSHFKKLNRRHKIKSIQVFPGGEQCQETVNQHPSLFAAHRKRRSP